MHCTHLHSLGNGPDNFLFQNCTVKYVVSFPSMANADFWIRICHCKVSGFLEYWHPDWNNYTRAVFKISPSRRWMPFIQFVVHTLISWGFSCFPSWLEGQRFAVGHSCKCDIAPLYIMKTDMGYWMYSCTHS